MKKKTIPKILLLLLIPGLVLTPPLWGGVAAPTALTFTGALLPIGGASQSPGALQTGPLMVGAPDYQGIYDEATLLLAHGVDFRKDKISLVPADTLEHALQNYADFNGGALFTAFCADYTRINAQGYCPPFTLGEVGGSPGSNPEYYQYIRNRLVRALELYGALSVSPANIMVMAEGQLTPVRELGRTGVLSAAQEIANIHLIFGNEFLVDATDYRFSTGGIPNADQIIALELEQLEQAQTQFQQAMDILFYAFQYPLGGEIKYGWLEGGGRVGDYFTAAEFELFGVASNRLMVALDEQATRYRQMGQDDVALALYNEAYAAQYLQIMALAQLAQENDTDYLINGSWEMLNNLSRLRAQAQAVHEGVDVLGYGRIYVPIQSYPDLLTLVEGPTGEAGLLGTAQASEEAARLAQREFDENATVLGREIEDLNYAYDVELFELCGTTHDNYATCTGGLIGQSEQAAYAASLRAGLAWMQAEHIADQIGIEEERAGHVINVNLGMGQTLSASALAMGKLRAQRTTTTNANSSEADVHIGAEAKLKYSVGVEAKASINPFHSGAEWKSGLEFSIEGVAGTGKKWTWSDSTQTVWDPNEERIAGYESLNALKQAEADAVIEGANSAAAIKNLLLQQSEALMEWEVSVADLNQVMAERRFLWEKYSRLLNLRGTANAYVLQVNAWRTNPAYRVMRDSLTIRAAQDVGRATQFAYLVGKAAEYDMLQPQPDLMADIYKARTAHDIRVFLDALKISYQALPIEPNLYPYTISLAKDIVGLTDRNLDPDNTLTPEQRAQLRYERFQEYLQARIYSDTLEIQFPTGLEFRRSDTQYLFSRNLWNNRIAGIGLIPGTTIETRGVRLNIVTRQTGDVGRPEVKLSHSGQATYRNLQDQIVCYDPGPAVPVGYPLPSGYDPQRTTVVLLPGINGSGAAPNSGLRNLSVAASSWVVQIPAYAKAELEYSQIEDIEILLDTTGKALQGREQAALRDAAYLQALDAGDPLSPEKAAGFADALQVTADASGYDESCMTPQPSSVILPPSGTTGITGTYFCSVLITSPIPSGVQVLAVNLQNLNDALTGQTVPEYTQIFPGDVWLSGAVNGDVFTLSSESFNTTALSQTVQQQFTLAGQAYEDADILRGRYTGQITGYLERPIRIEGSVSCSRPGRPGQALNALVVKASPEAIPVGGSARVTATVYATATQGLPITLTTSLGSIAPSPVTPVDGVGYATFTAGMVTGTATIVATNGQLTGTRQVEIFQPTTPVGLQARAAQPAIPISSSTVISAFLVNAVGQPLARSTRITFTTTLGDLAPPAADTDAAGFAQVTFTGGITPGLATLRATDGTYNAILQIRVVDPTIPTEIHLHAADAMIPLDGSTVISAALLNDLGHVLTSTTRLTFTSDLGVLTPPTATTDAGGWAQVAFGGVITPGLATLQATDGALIGVTQVEIVDPATPITVQVAIAPAALQVGESAAVTATLFNGLGQVLAHTAHVSFTADLGGITPAGLDVDNGVAVATFTAGATPGRAVILAISGEAHGTAQVEIAAAPETFYTLTVSIVGQGAVTRAPSQTTYLSGTLVTLTAQPAPGWRFTGWSGDLTGQTNPAQVTMDADKAITAAFEEIRYRIYLPLVLRNTGY